MHHTQALTVVGMKNCILWYTTTRSLLKVNQVSKKQATSIFRVEAKQETNMKQVAGRAVSLPSDYMALNFKETELLSTLPLLLHI
jgi:hypothetical protein